MNAVAGISTLSLHFDKRLLASHGRETRPDLAITRYVRMVLAGWKI